MTENKIYPYYFESCALLNTDTQTAFVYLDDPMKLSSHMGQSSWMTAGSKMEMKLDQKQGHGVGAEIILKGKMMGLPLFVREIVTESQAPYRKTWETIGPQKMIIIDQYQMGFEIIPKEQKSQLKVYIKYNVPQDLMGKIFGKVFSKIYARWCTEQMVKDAQKHFA